MISWFYTLLWRVVYYMLSISLQQQLFIKLLWPCTTENLTQTCILLAEFTRLIMSYKPGSHVTDNCESEWSEAGKSVFVAVSSFVWWGSQPVVPWCFLILSVDDWYYGHFLFMFVVYVHCVDPVCLLMLVHDRTWHYVDLPGKSMQHLCLATCLQLSWQSSPFCRPAGSQLASVLLIFWA